MTEGERKPPGCRVGVALCVFFRYSTEGSFRLLSSSSNAGTPRYTVPHYLPVVPRHSAKLVGRRVPKKGFTTVLQVEALRCADLQAWCAEPVCVRAGG